MPWPHGSGIFLCVYLLVWRNVIILGLVWCSSIHYVGGFLFVLFTGGGNNVAGAVAQLQAVIHCGKIESRQLAHDKVTKDEFRVWFRDKSMRQGLDRFVATHDEA